MEKNSKHSLLDHFRKNALGWTMQGIALLVLILNLWLASKLAPLAKDLAVITQKVKALENTRKEYVTQAEYQATLKSIDQRLENIERRFE